MIAAIILSSVIILSIADDNGGCCECTDSLYGPNCNDECDSNICSYDPYCCNVEWDWICADAACTECDECQQEEPDYGSWSDYNDYGDYGDYGDYDYEDSWYDDYDQYGYDYECDCNYICGDESPEEWESNIYEEVPECIVDNCGEQFQACAFNDECVIGIENVVNTCYESESDESSQSAVECMDALIADEENAGFIAACNGNEECGADLAALGACVANQANYGFCPEEVMKKLNWRSLVKRIKIKSRKSKRKSAALKSKSKRSRKKRSRPRSRKVRGRRESKLRKSRRKLQSDSESSEYDSYENEWDSDYGSDYDNPEYDYGCYCDCGEEDDEIPPCIIDNCSEQLFTCTSSEDCVQGIVGVEATCYEDNDNPEECMNELIQESNGQQAIDLCNGNEKAAGDLQVLGQCVSNVFASGDCGEPYKKLKIKALIRSTKKVRARKVASKLRRSRSLQRARSVRAQRLRKAKLGKKQRSRTRARPRAEAQRKARAQRVRKLRSKRQRATKLRGRKQRLQRRKLGSAGGDEACCDCTQEEDGTGCSANPECDQIVCPLDSWCCNNQWDYICANGANNICNAADYWSWNTNYDDYGDESWYDDSYYPDDSGTEGSCCDCTGESYGPGCNSVCDNEVCSLDSYCCNNQWDSICANGADNICQGYDYFGSSDDSWNDWDSFGYDYSWNEPYDFDDSYNDVWDYGFSAYEPNYDSFGYGYGTNWNSGADYSYPQPNYGSYYPPAKQRKARLAKRAGARSRRAIAQKRRERVQRRRPNKLSRK